MYPIPSTPLREMINSKGRILADGATGTNLFNIGLSSGDSPELWNKFAPEKIKSLYQASVDAGSDLFLTNSFGGNRSRLNLHRKNTKRQNFRRCQLKLDESWWIRPVAL